jgi:hypothetical protein
VDWWQNEGRKAHGLSVKNLDLGNCEPIRLPFEAISVSGLLDPYSVSPPFSTGFHISLVETLCFLVCCGRILMTIRL